MQPTLVQEKYTLSILFVYFLYTFQVKSTIKVYSNYTFSQLRQNCVYFKCTFCILKLYFFLTLKMQQWLNVLNCTFMYLICTYYILFMDLRSFSAALVYFFCTYSGHTFWSTTGIYLFCTFSYPLIYLFCTFLDLLNLVMWQKVKLGHNFKMCCVIAVCSCVWNLCAEICEIKRTRFALPVDGGHFIDDFGLKNLKR